MSEITDGKHFCPVMTRDLNNPIYCRKDCAVIAKWSDRDEIVYYFCGMMPP